MRVWYKVKDPIEQLQIFIATLLLINWLGDCKTVPELDQKVLRVLVGNQSGDLSRSWHLAILTNWPSGMNIREARNQSAVRGRRVQAQWELSEYNQYPVCQAVITVFSKTGLDNRQQASHTESDQYSDSQQTEHCTAAWSLEPSCPLSSPSTGTAAALPGLVMQWWCFPDCQPATNLFVPSPGFSPVCRGRHTGPGGCPGDLLLHPGLLLPPPCSCWQSASRSHLSPDHWTLSVTCSHLGSQVGTASVSTPVLPVPARPPDCL